jgi:hypothetical protein
VVAVVELAWGAVAVRADICTIRITLFPQEPKLFKWVAAVDQNLGTTKISNHAAVTRFSVIWLQTVVAQECHTVAVRLRQQKILVAQVAEETVIHLE